MSLAKAIAFAAAIHEEQYDKGGEPYILHVLKVMDNVKVPDWDRDNTTRTVAVLHDVIEDNTKFGERFILETIERDFGHYVLSYLMCLTKKKGEDYLGSYIPRVIKGGEVCMNVKSADLGHNLSLLRQPSLKDKDLLRLQKYHMAYRMIEEARPWTKPGQT